MVWCGTKCGRKLAWNRESNSRVKWSENYLGEKGKPCGGKEGEKGEEGRVGSVGHNFGW